MVKKPLITLVRPLIREYVNRILAENLEHKDTIFLIPPLNLCCLAAELEKNGYDVTIYDCEANDDDEKLLEDYLRKTKPDIVGISLVTLNFRGGLETAKIARKALPDAKILCGGVHMMIFPTETMSHPEFDYGFIGEAEKPLVEFLNIIQSGSNDLDKVTGLVWRSEGTIKINEPFGFNEDLDSLPYPAYHLLDLSAYSMANIDRNVICLFLSRGCPFNCGFCFRGPQLKKVRFKSVEKIIDEIEYMVNNFNARSFNFVDETITLKKKYFLEFCDKLISKGLNIEWQAPTRVTSVDEDIIRAAKQSGCHTLRFGIESGSDEVLKKINKGITTEKSREALRLCKKYGISTVGYFIIGYLGETEETIMKTISFTKEIRPDYAMFYPATPFPATELFTESEQLGLVPKNYWNDFVLGKRSNPLPFLFPNADKWAAKAYREFYFSPYYILKQLKTRKFYTNFFKNFMIAMNLIFVKVKRNKT